LGGGDGARGGAFGHGFIVRGWERRTRSARRARRRAKVGWRDG
jgi:hypothetical protein